MTEFKDWLTQDALAAFRQTQSPADLEPVYAPPSLRIESLPNPNDPMHRVIRIIKVEPDKLPPPDPAATLRRMMQELSDLELLRALLQKKEPKP